MYDPMMPADEYWRDSEYLRERGWRGVGDYWWSPRTGKCRTLGAALEIVALEEFSQRAWEQMQKVGQAFLDYANSPKGKAVIEAFSAMVEEDGEEIGKEDT